MGTPVHPTVESEIKRLFPNGTQGFDRAMTWKKAPLSPVETFAAAAHLLSASGAYSLIVAAFDPARPNAKDVAYAPPSYSASTAEIEEWVRIGREWANKLRSPEVEEKWARLWARRRARLIRPETASVKSEWWKVAHALLVISDEACAGLGYSAGSTTNWANELYSYVLESRTERWIIPTADKSPFDENKFLHIGKHVAMDSLCIEADRHVARVLPKGRTTELGCTLRALSHNLALLPPHGHPNTYWHQFEGAEAPELAAPLHLLIVPFPYIVEPTDFQGVEATVGRGSLQRRWGRFKIKQNWLNSSGSHSAKIGKFVDFIESLIKKSATEVNVILFPEYALDWATYDSLVRHILVNQREVELLIAGVSSDCQETPGNIVTSTRFRKSVDGKMRIAETHSRGKHHRWFVDGEQIRNYGLTDSLDPDVAWWEFLDLSNRLLHVDVLRSGSTFTAVICEDLARVEPGLSLVRSIGPTLVFALLMDGPQTKQRWPAVYATGLADDPGSSVLTLTSVGLIDRSNNQRKGIGKTVGPRSVALWRGRPSTRVTSNFQELVLEDNHHALLLKLFAEKADETTIDGRMNDDAVSWVLEHHESFGLSEQEMVDGGWQWIASRGV